MIKKIISVLLIALMLTFVFASCGDEPETPDDTIGENTDNGNGENNGNTDNGNNGNENDKPVDPENPQGLAFTLKDDGTYSVGIGEAGELSKIEIPATYKGVAVTEIGAIGDSTTTSSSNNVLTEIVIPDSIKNISDKAFYNCKIGRAHV